MGKKVRMGEHERKCVGMGENGKGWEKHDEKVR